MPTNRPIKIFGASSFWFAALLVVSLGLVCIVVGTLLSSARTLELKRASTEVANISAVLTQDLDRNIELYDLSIQGVIDGLANETVMAATPELRRLILFDRAATAHYLGALLVLDAAGNVVSDSASITPRPYNYADRDYFKVQAERPDVGLYIGKPVASRTDGKMIIGLSRRINKPDGSFDGIVVGTLQLDYFRALFSQMKLGRSGAVTLFRDDGMVIMREPFDAAQIGRIAKPPMIFKRLETTREGEVQAKSVIDGVERLFHFARVGALPLVQDVALSVEDIYADWWRKVYAISAVLLVCCGIVFRSGWRCGANCCAEPKRKPPLFSLRRRTVLPASPTAAASTRSWIGSGRTPCGIRRRSPCS
ncbi:cache domain-containing protein [Beijerinckia sp. L45]|uniref:cache domain-containing protein n=1 Tax=Beijerinckia sp. L45 TaxID=1641855 RepID=UPI00131B164C|nr:cache domain-containing protein [Beijerinckia sp. L45]